MRLSRMKRLPAPWRLLCVILLIAGMATGLAAGNRGDVFPGKPLHLLFLGNSYTQANSLPVLVRELAASGGKAVEVDANTPGGYTLEEHSTDAVSLQKIDAGGWDYVILQEQSQIPTIDFYRETSMYPAARMLDDRIAAGGAETVFFMTWGREFGGKQSIHGHTSPAFPDFFAMQESLRAAYTGIAGEREAITAPVGMAWARALLRDPFMDLWQPDHSHPTIRGSYLAACVFYMTLFHESPVGLSFTAGLPPEDARLLQTAAQLSITSDLPMTRQIINRRYGK